MAESVVKKVTTENTTDDGARKSAVEERASASIDRKKKIVSSKKMTAKEREELLIENFVGLQHAMTNMSIKFGSLSDNISKLLHIFEESAKNFVSGGKPDDSEMLEKINSLLNQNKTIAKGLVLMEGKLRGRADVRPSAPPRVNPSAQQPAQPSMPSNPGPRPLPTS